MKGFTFRLTFAEQVLDVLILMKSMLSLIITIRPVQFRSAPMEPTQTSWLSKQTKRNLNVRTGQVRLLLWKSIQYNIVQSIPWYMYGFVVLCIDSVLLDSILCSYDAFINILRKCFPCPYDRTYWIEVTLGIGWNKFCQNHENSWPVWMIYCDALYIVSVDKCRKTELHRVNNDIIPLLQWISISFLTSNKAQIK